MTELSDELVKLVADRIQERMGPLFGSPEYLADPVKLARAEKRQRDKAESDAQVAIEAALSILTPSENALREALEKIAENDSDGLHMYTPQAMQAIARAALNQTPPAASAAVEQPAVAELPTPTPVDAGDGDTGDVL